MRSIGPISLGGALFLPALLVAQQPAPPVKVRAPAALLAQAKITADSAEKVALKRVPGGTISEAELENERHRLFLSFDV